MGRRRRCEVIFLLSMTWRIGSVGDLVLLYAVGYVMMRDAFVGLVLAIGRDMGLIEVDGEGWTVDN